jgi:hypothetical protein
MLGGPQSWSEGSGEQKNITLLPEIELKVVQTVA